MLQWSTRLDHAHRGSPTSKPWARIFYSNAPLPKDQPHLISWLRNATQITAVSHNSFYKIHFITYKSNLFSIFILQSFCHWCWCRILQNKPPASPLSHLKASSFDVLRERSGLTIAPRGLRLPEQAVSLVSLFRAIACQVHSELQVFVITFFLSPTAR